MISPKHLPSYRPDIDGLRAIAVLAVVVFHAFPDWLPGGFAGVDMFFVISGFLITGLLLRDHAQATFSLRDFYARRIKRIFPALALVLSVCLAVGWLMLTSEEFSALGTFTSGGAAFANNFLFWRASGYFDTAADTKPLLHLWSLGIEEQFYMLWPLLLWLMFRRPRWVGAGMVACLVVSLVYSLWAIRADAVLAFYSPLARFWELVLGGVLAYGLRHYPDALSAWRGLAAYVGLLLIGLAFALLDKDAAFPGYWALLPTVGTALVIFSGEQVWVKRRVLSGTMLVAVGLISYPLYLWHWPLLSFARILISETPSVPVRLVLVALSGVLAWLTYLLLERPIRFRSHSTRVVPALCVAMFAVFLAGHAVTANDGFKARNYALLNADPGTMVNGADRGNLEPDCLVGPDSRALFEWCMRDRKARIPYAVLGDSKGESLFFGLARETSGPDGWRLLGAVHHVAGESAAVNQAAYRSIEQDPNIRVVVFANALRGMFPLNKQSGFIDIAVSDADIDRNVATYSRAFERFARAGKRSVFVVDNPSLPDPNSCVSGGLTSSPLLNRVLVRQANRYCTIRYTDHLQGTRAYRQFVERLRQRNPEVLVFDPTPLLCDVAGNVCTITEGRNFLYSYGDHISDYASSKISRELLPLIYASKF